MSSEKVRKMMSVHDREETKSHEAGGQRESMTLIESYDVHLRFYLAFWCHAFRNNNCLSRSSRLPFHCVQIWKECIM